jgi:ubiquinone/menaquinone biosynthesis C-methylase UbiE
MFLRENEIIRKLAPWVRPGQTLLDVGSGTGLIARRLAKVAGVKPTLCDLVDYCKVDEFPYIKLEDPLRVSAPDDSFDVVTMCFVLHHVPEWEDQLTVAAEAMRVARERVLILEDTPFHKVDLLFNKAWDKVLNMRHGVPVPFTFRNVEEWTDVFSRDGFRVSATHSYRPKWPTLAMYHHTLFVLDRAR